MEKLYSEAVKFLKNIAKGEKVLILSHWDMDGISSAAVISRVLRNLRGKEADFFKIPEDRRHDIDEKTEKKVSKGEIDKVIILDINPGYEALQKLLKHLRDKILIIDHHNFERIPEGTVFVNPRVERDDVYASASRLCYRIASKLDINLDWIAGLGIIQDFDVKNSKDIFEGLKKKYPAYFPDEISQENLAKRCRYGNISKVINIKPYKDTQKCAEAAYRLLMEINDLRNVENSPEYYELKEMYWDVMREIENIIENYFEERELIRDKKVSFFKFSSDFHINSSIATNISMKELEWIHIIIKEEDQRVNISARCQSGEVNLGELLKKALPESAFDKGEAGGHRKAAGASFPKKYYKEFKNNFLELL